MKGFYINLKERTDRKDHVENLQTKFSFFENVKRFNAIKNKRGDIGCSMSHYKCLKECLQMSEKYYMILEDDFCLLNHDHFYEFEKEFMKIKESDDWDVIVLTPSGNTQIRNYVHGFHKIVNNQTTGGYIIKHTFITTLLPYIESSIINLTNNKDSNIYALDQVWKPLQENNIFLYYSKIYAGQLPCYSDIEKRIVNYNHRYLDQLKY